MNLLLDIGNSTVKWSIVENNCLTTMRNAKIDFKNPVKSVIASLREVPECSVILCCSVRDENFNKMLVTEIDLKFSKSLYFVDHNNICDHIKMDFASYPTIGMDRLTALIGAQYLSHKGCIVIDCGTAITIDAVGPDAIYMGGIILPGVDSMKKVFFSDTHVEEAIVAKEVTVFAGDTATAIHSGCFIAASSAIDMACAQMRALSDQVDKVYITGGNASLFNEACSTSFIEEPMLLMQGLRKIATGIA